VSRGEQNDRECSGEKRKKGKEGRKRKGIGAGFKETCNKRKRRDEVHLHDCCKNNMRPAKTRL
jgi:hypothetical protein